MRIQGTPIETEFRHIKLDLMSLQLDILDLQQRLIELRDSADGKDGRVDWLNDLEWDTIDVSLHHEIYDANRYARYLISIFEDLNIDPFIKIENKEFKPT
jgi:hypothetical protein